MRETTIIITEESHTEAQVIRDFLGTLINLYKNIISITNLAPTVIGECFTFRICYLGYLNEIEEILEPILKNRRYTFQVNLF